MITLETWCGWEGKAYWDAWEGRILWDDNDDVLMLLLDAISNRSDVEGLDLLKMEGNFWLLFCWGFELDFGCVMSPRF